MTEEYQTEVGIRLDDFQFWKTARRLNSSEGERRYLMQCVNWSRAKLAKAIREAETKLNRPHRHLPRLGCVQYIHSRPAKVAE